jgi:hypothetical protein
MIRNDDSLSDRLHEVVEDGTMFERKRLERGLSSTRHIPQKLTYQSLLFGALALVHPMYALSGAETLAYLPTFDSGLATPKILLLALASYAFELIAMTLFLLTAVYHIRHDPIDETQAETLINSEGVATWVAFGTGALCVLLTLGFFTIALTGHVDTYVGMMDGTNPFEAVTFPITVETMGFIAFVTALACFFAGQWLRTAYPVTTTGNHG